MPRWVSALRTRSARSSAACWRRSSGTRPKVSARTRLAWVCGVTLPSSAMNSVRQASTTWALSSAYRSASAVFAEQRGDRGGVPGRPGVERGGDVGLVGGDEGREVRRARRRARATRPSGSRCPRGTARAGEATAERATRSGCRSPDAIRSTRSSQPTIAGQISAQHRGVAVLLVQLPRHQDDRVAPAGRAVHLLQEAGPLGDRHRRHVAEVAVRPLLDGEVAQPLEGEAVDVVEVGRGRDVELPVAGPAGALAGRAVGRDVAGVAAEAPHRGLVQPVDPVVVAREGAARRQVGVHDDAGDVAGRERAGVALDPDVPEAVGGEPRLEDVAVDGRPRSTVSTWPALSGSGRNGARRARGAPCVTSPSGPSASPWVSVISVPAGPEVGEPDPAVDVLAEVDDVHAGRSRVTDTGRSSSTARTGGAGERTSASYPRSLTGDRLPVALDADEPAVLALPLDQVGGQDVRRRPAPGRRRCRRPSWCRPRARAGAGRGTPSRCPTGRRRERCRPGRGTSRRRAARRARARPAPSRSGDVVGLDLGAVVRTRCSPGSARRS